MFIEDSYAIIIVLFQNIFRVPVVKAVLQSMPQLLHVYTSLLHMEGKIVPIRHMRACRTSGA